MNDHQSVEGSRDLNSLPEPPQDRAAELAPVKTQSAAGSVGSVVSHSVERLPTDPPGSAPASAAKLGPLNTRRRGIIGVLALGLLAAAGYVGMPLVGRSLSTVSTDDAYINGHVTFVAARVPGQVDKVFVDDNDRVRTGDLLVQLDKKPYQVIVELKQAAYAVAEADLVVAENQVVAMVAQMRSNRFKLDHAIEEVKNQIALLRATVAALETAKAKLARAAADYQRALELQKTKGVISQEVVDQRKELNLVAEAQVKQALQQVYQIRVGLGLAEQPETEDLSEVPPDLDQNFSSVRAALAALVQSAAAVGVSPSSYNITPKQLIAEFYQRDPDGNLDRIYAKIMKAAPSIKLAQAKVTEAQRDVDQSQLNLSYCEVVAEIDGVITRRDVNPGNNVIAGQSLMALRSLTDIWVDANFKETQLADLRIGQAVDLDVDMYGSRQEFRGRISGFAMGTGSTLALLPAENATGNFVKVVQRLSVRIEILDYDADRAPLFVGSSVTPYVRVKEPLTGPDAGKVLRPYAPKTSRPTASTETKS